MHSECGGGRLKQATGSSGTRIVGSEGTSRSKALLLVKLLCTKGEAQRIYVYTPAMWLVKAQSWALSRLYQGSIKALLRH
jgi:hypothetical protein